MGEQIKVKDLVYASKFFVRVPVWNSQSYLLAYPCSLEEHVRNSATALCSVVPGTNLISLGLLLIWFE